MFRTAIALAVAMSTFTAKAANTVEVNNLPAGHKANITKVTGECVLLKSCIQASISSPFATNTSNTYNFVFDLVEQVDAMAFRLFFFDQDSYFKISNSRVDWLIDVRDEMQIIFTNSVSSKDGNWIDFAFDASGLTGKKITASIQANAYAGYSLSISDDPFCASIYCMPVQQRNISPQVIVAVGAIPEPSSLLMFIPAAAIVASRRWKSRQSAT